MRSSYQSVWMLLTTGALLFSSAYNGYAGNDDIIPQQFTKEQRENLLRFLQKHEKPDRYIPQDARIVGSQPGTAEVTTDAPPGKPIKQYTVQIAPHRPVPGQEEVKRADVVYYRPNPE